MLTSLFFDLSLIDYSNVFYMKDIDYLPIAQNIPWSVWPWWLANPLKFSLPVHGCFMCQIWLGKNSFDFAHQVSLACSTIHILDDFTRMLHLDTLCANFFQINFPDSCRPKVPKFCGPKKFGPQKFLAQKSHSWERTDKRTDRQTDGPYSNIPLSMNRSGITMLLCILTSSPHFIVYYIVFAIDHWKFQLVVKYL